MYFEAIAIAAELKEFPGGPKALAISIYPTIEGMRLIRWPADRLDTLGGYLAYHNIVLFNFFLAIFAAVQGAKLIRSLEENRNIEIMLATGITRTRFLLVKSFSFITIQLSISVSLGIGTALALQVSGQPNTSGAMITLLAGGVCVLPFFGLGLLDSQLTTTSKLAAGFSSLIVTAIYAIDNISGKYEWLMWFQNLSPFHYANKSRPVIPVFESEYVSWLVTGLFSLALAIPALYLFKTRDIEGPVFKIKTSESKSSSALFVPKGLVGDNLWRQRIGLTTWILTTAIFIGVFVSMAPGIIDIWKEFTFLQQFSTSGFGKSPEEQYFAMVFEILPPFFAAFILTQSSKWTSDFVQGRVTLFLSTSLSWNKLILKRTISALIGAALIVSSSVVVILIGASIQNAENYYAHAIRAIVIMLLFALTFISLNMAIVSILRNRNPIQFLSLYVGASWLIDFMTPYLHLA